jgi:hypothetical protein
MNLGPGRGGGGGGLKLFLKLYKTNIKKKIFFFVCGGGGGGGGGGPPPPYTECENSIPPRSNKILFVVWEKLDKGTFFPYPIITLIFNMHILKLL